MDPRQNAWNFILKDPLNLQHEKHLHRVHEERSCCPERNDCETKRKCPPNHLGIFKIPQARKVGSSYITLMSIFSSAHIVLWKTNVEFDTLSFSFAKNMNIMSFLDDKRREFNGKYADNQSFPFSFATM